MNTGKRPLGWTQIKHRRVNQQENQDRRAGVNEVDIISKRPQREEAVSVYISNNLNLSK